MIPKERINEIFLAMKLHLRGAYNFCEYNGRVNKKVKFVFAPSSSKLQKIFKEEDEFTEFLLANFIHLYFGRSQLENHLEAFCNPSSLKVYKKFILAKSQLYYNLRRDCEYILKKYDSLNVIVDLKSTISEIENGNISLLSVIILLKYSKKLHQRYLKDPMLDEMSHFLWRVSIFIEYDKKKVLEILKSLRNDN